MLDSSIIREWGRRFGSRRLLAVNLILFGLIAWSFSGEYMRDRDNRAIVATLQQQSDTMVAEINSRKAELEVSSSEVETEARLKLNMRRPGEEVVVVKGSSLRVHSEGSVSAKATGGGNASKWWKLFFE